MAPVNPNRVYEDYEPPTDVVTEEGCETILIYLPGYRKEQLRVQLSTSRVLKISGERQLSGNRWRRFSKEFRIPANTDAKEITAKFEGGILYIRQPKLITPAAPPAATEQPADRGQTSVADAPKAPTPRQAAPVLPRRQSHQAPDVPQHQPQRAPALPQQQTQRAPEFPQQQTQRPPEFPQEHTCGVPDYPQQQTQRAPDFPQQQTQRAPDFPQPHPRQQAAGLPQAQPQSQPQPLPEPERGMEEKTGRKESEEDAAKKEKEGKDKCEFKPRQAQTGGRRRPGLYQELRKPESMKRLAVSVLLVVGIGFYVTYMLKSFLGDSARYDGEL